jgi:hypothetical protein
MRDYDVPAMYVSSKMMHMPPVLTNRLFLLELVDALFLPDRQRLLVFRVDGPPQCIHRVVDLLLELFPILLDLWIDWHDVYFTFLK